MVKKEGFYTAKYCRQWWEVDCPWGQASALLDVKDPLLSVPPLASLFPSAFIWEYVSQLPLGGNFLAKACGYSLYFPIT